MGQMTQLIIIVGGIIVGTRLLIYAGKRIFGASSLYHNLRDCEPKHSDESHYISPIYNSIICYGNRLGTGLIVGAMVHYCVPAWTGWGIALAIGAIVYVIIGMFFTIRQIMAEANLD